MKRQLMLAAVTAATLGFSALLLIGSSVPVDGQIRTQSFNRVCSKIMSRWTCKS